MVDDDDPKSRPAPTGVPADAPEPEAETEPEGDQPEGDTEATEASADDEAGVDETDDDAGDEDGDDAPGDEPERKRPSRVERYKRNADRYRAERDEALRSRFSGSLPPDEASFQRAVEHRVQQEIGEPPKEEDFKGDYVRYAGEMNAYLADKRLATRQIREKFVEAAQSENARVNGLLEEHKIREAKFKTQVKDYDAVMASVNDIPVAPHVKAMLLESKKSQHVGYVLAKDRALLMRLNHMDPQRVAREIGYIEGRLSLPQAKQQTQARKPIAPLRGGGTSPPSQMAEINAYMKKQYGEKY